MTGQHAYFKKLSARKEGRLDVVVVCDSYRGGVTSMEIYESFLAQFGKDFLFQHHGFDFRSVADSRCTEKILRVAAITDVIIIASARKELPAYVQEWLSALALVRAKDSGVLIALVPHDAPSTICESFEYAARVSGLEFWRINLSCPLSQSRPRCPWCFPWTATNPVSETENSIP